MKDYIRDNGKIRNCDSNIAKMNIFEYVWLDIINNKVLKYGVLDISEQYIEAFKNLFYAIINTILMIFFPVSLLIKANSSIKRAKKQVEKHKKTCRE